MTAWSKQIAKPEVDDLDVSIFTDENIFDLEVSVDNAVPVTVVESAGDLTAELAGLLLLQLAMGNDIVKHLAAIDVLAEHVPMVVGAHNVSHTTDVGMAQERDDGCLSGGPDFLRLVRSLLVRSCLMLCVFR